MADDIADDIEGKVKDMASDNDIVRDKYIITYHGTLEEFNRSYLEQLQRYQFVTKKPVEIPGAVIVPVAYLGEQKDLEERLENLKQYMTIEKESVRSIQK